MLPQVLQVLQVLLHRCCCWAWTYPSRCVVVLKYYVASRVGLFRRQHYHRRWAKEVEANVEGGIGIPIQIGVDTRPVATSLQSNCYTNVQRRHSARCWREETKAKTCSAFLVPPIFADTLTDCFSLIVSQPPGPACFIFLRSRCTNTPRRLAYSSRNPSK